MSDHETILERLRAVHDFPGEFLFKAIGPNTEVFMAQVVQSVIIVAGPHSTPNVESRVSAQANHLSVNITAVMESAESVVEVYRLLRGIEGVTYVL